MKFKTHLIILVALISLQLNAQYYTVKGKVTGVSFESLTMVYVHVKDQINNTATNEDGEFKIRLTNGKYTLFFTCLGYETFKQDVIVENKDVSLNIILNEDKFLLNEVDISSKYSDPAKKIIQQVIKNKSKYIQTSYQCELYIKAVESTNETLIKKDSLKKISQRIDSLKFTKDTTKAKKTNALIYDHLNIAEVVIKKSFEYPDKLKEERIAYESIGKTASLFYLSTTEGEFNFYQNAVSCPSISVMPFQSPLSAAGLIMYKYKTLKVFEQDGKRIYRIRVEPTIFSNSLVSGEMEIIDSLFCLRSFNFYFPKHQLSEYNSFQMEAEYIPSGNTLYRLNKMIFNYKSGSEKNGSHGRTSVYINEYKYEKKFDKKYFNEEVSTTFKEAYDKDSSFWNKIRKEPLTEKELKFIRVSDSIKTAHQTKAYTDSVDKKENKITAMKIAFTGQTKYNRAKEFRMYFAPLIAAYQAIGPGGTRLNYYVYFSKKLENKKRYVGNSTIGYGIVNHDVTGRIALGQLYNPFRSSFWQVTIGKSYNVVNASDVWTSVFRSANYYLKESINAFHSTEIFNGFYWAINTEYSARKSINSYRNDDLTNLILDNKTAKPIGFISYDAFNITNTASYTPKQKYIREPNEKIVLGSKFPTFSVSYRKGIPTIFNSKIQYDYLEYSITQDIDFRFLGISKIRLNTGKFLNDNLVKEIDYTYQPRVGAPFFANPLSSFQSLEKSYITLARYYSGHYFHRFNGALINKIPFVKYLKITESAGASFLKSQENNLLYFEAYAGLEKNVRIFNETFRFGIYIAEGKTNDLPFRTDFRISIDKYNKMENKWGY